MKKYSSGSFVDAAVRVYGSEADTLTSFPASIIANGDNITPWTVYGNSVEGVSVGKKTTNICSDINTATISAIQFYIDDFKNIVDDYDTFTLSFTTDITLSSNTLYLHTTSNEPIGYISGTGEISKAFTLTEVQIESIKNAATPYILIYKSNADFTNTSRAMINTGNTDLPYEPYGYKLPVVIGSNTTNIYMADVLRMSSGADPVYDIMSSTGIITRNVDTDGTPLVTPTTENFTAPTLATVAGSQSVSFDTTVKPSKAELTYTGWHDHSDKKRSGGAWT